MYDQFEIENGQNEDGQKLNRQQRRYRLYGGQRHFPEFTKKCFKKKSYSKLEKKQIQRKYIRDKLIARGVWDEMKWKVDPYWRQKLHEMMIEFRKGLQE